MWRLKACLSGDVPPWTKEFYTVTSRDDVVIGPSSCRHAIGIMRVCPQGEKSSSIYIDTVKFPAFFGGEKLLRHTGI